MTTSPFTLSFAPTSSTHREIPKSLVLVAGLAALAVTPWIESPSARFLTQGAILSFGAVYLYHDRHHKGGDPFLSTEIQLPLWGKRGWYGTGRSLSVASIADEHGAPIPLSAKETMVTVHFAKTKLERHCWLCDALHSPPTLPEEAVIPKDFLTQAGNSFRFQYDGELVEATKSAQFDANIAQIEPPETTLAKTDRPASWTCLKELLVSTDAETLRLEPGWQRYKINEDGRLILHGDQVLSDLFRSFKSASLWEPSAILQELKVEEWPCYLMARRLTRLEEVDVLIHKNRLLIAIPVPPPSASSSPLTVDEDAQMRERERSTPKHYYYDIELNGSYSLIFRIAGENLEVSGSPLEDLS